MTPLPSTILSSERDRSSAVAWGTLCLLAVVQMGLVAKLIFNSNASDVGGGPVAATATAAGPMGTARPASATSKAPVSPSVSAPAPSMVPEVGQISLPQPAPAPAPVAPPLPGSLLQVPVAPPVSNGPPPIGSFTKPGTAEPAPTLPGAAYVPQVSSVPPQASAPSLPAAAGASASQPYALPGASAPVPPMPPAGTSESYALPGATAPVPPAPPVSTSQPYALPGAASPAPATMAKTLPGAASVPQTAPGNASLPKSMPPAMTPGATKPMVPVPQTPVAPPQTTARGPDLSTPKFGPNMNFPDGTKPKTNAANELLRDVNYVVTSAKELRGLSDMKGVLDLLKAAGEVNPEHPAIIAELAQTYEQMGITAKAMDAWRQIQLMGPTKAGSYYELATRRLGSGSAAVTVPGGASLPGGEAEKFLRLGACQAERDFKVNGGERYVLHVPIQRAGNRPINSQELNLEVFFFDRVNNVQVAQTIAPEPVETWQSSPVDWNGTGEELLDVVYHLPALSPAEIQQHGRRSYYGYMLRLYYNNKLQDVAAEPRDLLEFGSTPGAAPGGGNPLLPPVGR